MLDTLSPPPCRFVQLLRWWGAPAPRALALGRRNGNNNDTDNGHDGPKPPFFVEWLKPGGVSWHKGGGFQRSVNRQYDRMRANAWARSRRQHRTVASSAPGTETCNAGTGETTLNSTVRDIGVEPV